MFGTPNRAYPLPTWLDVPPWRGASGASAASPNCTRQNYRRVQRRCPLRGTQTILCQQLGQMSQDLAYHYGRRLHPPDALIEPVFSRRDGLHDLDGDGPSSRSPAFFECSAPPHIILDDDETLCC